MLKWLSMLIPLYLAYYTLVYGKIVWVKEKNRLAVAFIWALAVSLVILPIWLIRK